MSKSNPSFIDLIEADIKLAQKEAEVIADTAVVNFKPQYTEKVTKEVVENTIEWLNHQGAIVYGATSNIAYDQFGETKKRDWTGVMDLGCMQITAMHQIRDVIDGPNGEEAIHGQCDLFFDYQHSEGLSEWYDHFMKIDEERCANLFKED